MTLNEARANPGREVVHQPAGGPPEIWTVAGTSTRCVFLHHPGQWGVKMTYPEDLTLAVGTGRDSAQDRGRSATS
jgi:hypothetical protein